MCRPSVESVWNFGHVCRLFSNVHSTARNSVYVSNGLNENHDVSGRYVTVSRFQQGTTWKPDHIAFSHVFVPIRFAVYGSTRGDFTGPFGRSSMRRRGRGVT